MLQQAAGSLHSRHAWLTHAYGLSATQPPPPHEGLLQWLALDDGQRQHSLHLARHICSARPCAPQAQHDPDADWCRSLGKALRPGLWLPATALDPRLLLGAWAGPPCWTRLRLLWPPDTLGEPPQALPSKRLDTLWTAILWRVTQVGQPHVD